MLCLKDLSKSEPQFKKYLKTRRVLYSNRYAHIQKVDLKQAVKSCKGLKTDWFKLIADRIKVYLNKIRLKTLIV
jgi:hypothetical protein